MDFLTLINTRESCRDYADVQISSEQLNYILEAGRLAPSACNTQPWHFFVVRGDKLREMKKAVQAYGRNKFTDGAQAFIVVVGETPAYPEALKKIVPKRDFSSYDIGIAVANMTLAATSIGLGTCILGVFDAEIVKSVCCIEKDDARPVHLVLSVGVPAKDTPREKTRRNSQEIYTFVD